MNAIRLPLGLALILFVAACVTINVYFPAEAAEKAADKIIQDIYGETPAAKPAEPQSLHKYQSIPAQQGNLLLDFFISSARAAGADISVNTAAIQQIKSAMEARHRELAPYYVSGAVGMTADGQIEIRDQKLVPLKERTSLKNLVARENDDRSALYREIARANEHPEWEGEIRQTFARRWVDNAPRGWWFTNSSGNWQQK